jgi:hypothetical protein
MTSTIKVDTISENTSANGVAVDGVTLKDGGFTATLGSTITTADNNPQLTLTSTDTDANSGPRLDFIRNPGEAGADADFLSAVLHRGYNDATELTTFVEMNAQIVDASNGSEDGRFYINTMVAGTAATSRMELTPTETVFNEGSANLDFRVESNGATHMLFVDGGNNGVFVNTDNSAGNLDGASFGVQGGVTFLQTGNSDNLTLLTTDADANVGPILNLYRNSSSPADNDTLGQLAFVGRNDNSQDFNAFQMTAYSSDVSDGTEDGTMQMYTMQNGSLHLAMHITPTETVFNDSSKDQDFRVESNSLANAFLVNGGTDQVVIGEGTLPGTPGGATPMFNIVGTSSATTTMNFHRGSANAAAPSFYFSKSRSATLGSFAIVNDGDSIGEIDFCPDDGTDINTTSARIKVAIDGTPGANDVPGRIQFLTTKDGAASPTEAMRINSTGAAKHASGDDALQGTLTNAIHNFSSAANLTVLELSSGHATFTNSVLGVGAKRSAVNSYNLIGAFTGNDSSDRFNDLEFRVKGDGNVLCDESFTGSGADYSEYFEWNDGNSSDLDRVGLSVKLSGNKIVASAGSDDAADIIGVVSGSPVIIGDADGTGTRWNKKYEKDDYGRAVYETYTITKWTEVVEDGDDINHSYATDRIPDGITAPSDATVISKEDDNTTDLIRRKLNSSWDATATYISRADRKEWDTIGLVGKLRMKKGQKTGTNWIKMRDISDTVEEWLVR